MITKEMVLEPEQPVKVRIRKRNSKTKKKRTGLKLLLLIVLSGSAITLLALSPLCTIASIQTHGNLHDQSEDIIRATGIVTGNNGFKSMGKDPGSLLKLRFGTAEEKIRKVFPYVKHVRVQYILPDKVRIQIEERKPVCILPYMAAYLVVDQEGFALETIDRIDEAAYPVVEGVEFDSLTWGQALKFKSKEAFSNSLKILDELTIIDQANDYKMDQKVNAIHAADFQNMILVLDSGLSANLGDLEDLEYRLKTLREICQQNVYTGQKVLVDFTGGENPVIKITDKSQ